MKKVVLIMCVIMVFLLVGCKDLTDSFKPGSFGQTTEEKAMVQAITEKYGDLTQKGNPRFLEAMMTSTVQNFIPVDKVYKYSKNSEKFYAWFVYDNFNEDELEIEWIYLNTNYSIHTFKSTTGEDFGRGSFILESPDDGWAIGKYKVTIRGRGIETVIDYEVIDGATVSVPISFNNGKITLPSTPAPSAVISNPTTPSQTFAQTTATTQPSPVVQKAWHLSEVQEWDDYSGVKLPYHISWTGKEGDLISTVTMDSPYNPISSINAKWTIPPETLVTGSEYQMEFSVTAINQNTASLGLEGSLTSGLDVFNVLPNGVTGARIRITPEDNYPRIRWNDPTGTVKSGKFTFKAPEYGFADSKNTNKMTLTVKYYSSAIIAWRYIYEWTDQDIKPVRTGGTPNNIIK